MTAASELMDVCALHGIGFDELWLRYYALGGAAAQIELDAYLNDAIELCAGEFPIIQEAVKEAGGERGELLDAERLQRTPPTQRLIARVTAHQARASHEKATQLRLKDTETLVRARALKVRMNDLSHRIDEYRRLYELEPN